MISAPRSSWRSPGARPGHRRHRAPRARPRSPSPSCDRDPVLLRGSLGVPLNAGDWLLRIMPAAVRAAAGVPGVPPGQHALRALLRLLPAVARGPAWRCSPPGPRPRWPWPPTCCGAGTLMGLALHAEWTKLRTLAGTWWLLLAAAALTIAVSAAAAAAFHCLPGACTPRQTGADPAKLGLTGVDLGQVVIALLAVLAIGGEYGTGMIRLTLTAVPRRLIAFTAKALVTAAAALAAERARGGRLAPRRLADPPRQGPHRGERLPAAVARQRRRPARRRRHRPLPHADRAARLRRHRRRPRLGRGDRPRARRAAPVPDHVRRHPRPGRWPATWSSSPR